MSASAVRTGSPISPTLYANGTMSYKTALLYWRTYTFSGGARPVIINNKAGGGTIHYIPNPPILQPTASSEVTTLDLTLEDGELREIDVDGKVGVATVLLWRSTGEGSTLTDVDIVGWEP